MQSLGYYIIIYFKKRLFPTFSLAQRPLFGAERRRLGKKDLDFGSNGLELRMLKDEEVSAEHGAVLSHSTFVTNQCMMTFQSGGWLSHSCN